MNTASVTEMRGTCPFCYKLWNRGELLEHKSHRLPVSHNSHETLHTIHYYCKCGNPKAMLYFDGQATRTVYGLPARSTSQDHIFGGFPHVVATQPFSRQFLDEVLFPKALQMHKRENIGNKDGLLYGKEMVSFFVGESLRTRSCFDIAFRRLGGKVIFESPHAEQYSSMKKGESLEDAIATLNEYLSNGREERGELQSCIVLRSDQEGDAAKAALVSAIPIINAGDGPGQHPTQGFLDLYTIYHHLGRIDGLVIALIGDVENSRTIHSLAYLLAKYKDITLYFVAPENRSIKKGMTDYLARHQVQVHTVTDIRDVAPKVDVLYQTRTQRNLGTQAWDRNDAKHGFTIINKEVMSLAKKDAIVMHPMPITEEIVREEVDDDPRAIYLKTRGNKISQVKAGLYIREALFALIFGA
jgi:aspartate carbamoyltransferase catalytic subunit